jgi:AbrB family looped-hinge helix DNA binding protein
MNYTHSITSKGQITIPKEFRDLLDLDKHGKATMQLNDRNEIVITKPKSLAEIRNSLANPTFVDSQSEAEQLIGSKLAKKYDVR